MGTRGPLSRMIDDYHESLFPEVFGCPSILWVKQVSVYDCSR
jgi:hypothetical protein